MTFSERQCEGGKVYKKCGNPCDEMTCEGSNNRTCTEDCYEGCYCEANMVLSGDECVPVEECGCYNETDGTYLKVSNVQRFNDNFRIWVVKAGIHI